MRCLEITDDLEIHALDLRQIDLFDVHEPQQLAHRPGHVAPAFVARPAALRDANVTPEFTLVHAQLAANVAWIRYTWWISHFNSLGRITTEYFLWDREAFDRFQSICIIADSKAIRDLSLTASDLFCFH